MKTRARLLKLVLDSGQASRAELTKLLGTSASTVTEITSELIDKGILYEAGYKNSAGKGRRNRLLDIDVSCGFALGAGVYDKTLSVGITTVKGGTLAKRVTSIADTDGVAEIVSAIKKAAEELMSDCCLKRDRLFGFGICAEKELCERLSKELSDGGETSLGTVFEPADGILEYADAYMPLNPSEMYIFGCAKVIRELFIGEAE